MAAKDRLELYDDLGRPKNISRSGVNVAYTYDDAGRLTLITNANGTKTVRVYDDVNRLTQIRHEGPSAQLLTQIDYNWRLDNTIDTRTETDATVQPQSVATVTFEYDNRRRLTREKRVVDSQTVYDIAYTYDQLGNRLTKADATKPEALGAVLAYLRWRTGSIFPSMVFHALYNATVIFGIGRLARDHGHILETLTNPVTLAAAAGVVFLALRRVRDPRGSAHLRMWFHRAGVRVNNPGRPGSNDRLNVN